MTAANNQSDTNKVRRSVSSDNIIILAKTSETAAGSTTRQTPRTSSCSDAPSQWSSLSGRGAAPPVGEIDEERGRTDRREAEREREREREKEERSGLRVTGPRFIRGERSKVIAQARGDEVSPAGSFRAATPSGRPHPRRRLVHAGSTSSRGRTTTTATTIRGVRWRSSGLTLLVNREKKKTRLGSTWLLIECCRRARLGRRMLRLRQGTRGSRIATLVVQAKAPRERGCHRGCVQVAPRPRENGTSSVSI